MCLLISHAAEIHSGTFDRSYSELETLIDEQVPVSVSRPSEPNIEGAIDYSEEAIPERDPSYRPVDKSLYDSPTTEVMSAAARRALARCLEQLGMSAARAAMVASL
jgi:hypothetical protein